jgi:hypothetical protein
MLLNISEFCEVSKVKAMLFLQECEISLVHVLTSQCLSITPTILTSIPEFTQE